MGAYIPSVSENVSAIQLISLGPVPMSGAGTSMPGPVQHTWNVHFIKQVYYCSQTSLEDQAHIECSAYQ